MCSRLLKTTVLAAVAGAMSLKMPQVIVRVKIKCRLSLKCWVLGREDWIRRGPGRLYLECVECGRETRGWTPATSRASPRSPHQTMATLASHAA